ncbi:D-amino acid oxidase [Sinorhizobium fredii USDA 205]|uniref:FAD-dependent oxidoreductase n=1 Tax=Rhizobium fredii TaxID=380 RepID=A0A844A6D6_RHIFR|nr:FAD-binding oxidoreductase [Sinorhizobium fredii]ASY72029.1 Small molecule metabolism [Sinorhizobium fredii CCBAU 83666]KSV83373.1 D-amino acid oxidase [Sinorhizobium fredii USDA 205]MQX08087.1 FAD-dependent oxidoreductase [Sinorhizobium fredii]GEC30875.1 D-amino-acid oxidase [Sinorhizobium fredii]GLS10426.1 D-amino-acid oxidase [Sinorhizobium fredii]
MPAPLLQIETTPALPTSADAVVIGGGIVGVFAAYHLARRGLKVALVEKGRIGAEQSSRNWGWCRQQNRDARELPMATKSLSLWEDFAGETGEDTGFRRCGLLYLSDDESELAGWARWGDFARTVGVTTHMLDGAQASEKGAATGRRWKGGVFSPTDGTADPARAAPVVARAVMKLGGTVHQMCAARGLELEAGRVSGVVTEAGTIRTPIVVLSGGAWVSSFCRQLGIRFPQASIRSSILSVAPGAEGLPAALHTAAVSATRRGDGGYTLAISGRARVDPTPQQMRFARHFVPMFARRWRSLAPGGFEGWKSGHETLHRWRLDEPTPMEFNRMLDPRPDQTQIRLTLERARALLPALQKLPVSAAWAGYIDSTPDGVPAIGEISSLPGLVLAAGFSGHGFGIGPGAGHLVADLVTGEPPIVDPKPYHPDRLNGSAWGKVADF